MKESEMTAVHVAIALAVVCIASASAVGLVLNKLQNGRKKYYPQGNYKTEMKVFF